MEAAGPGANGTNSPQSQKRQRAKQACEPCRLRKRRCDGNSPCDMCTQFEYKCYFEKHPRKRSKLVEQGALQDGILEPHGSPEYNLKPRELPREDQPSLEDYSKLKSMEANSGIAFTRLLGLRLDPSSGPKLFNFGWNLGSRTYAVPAVPSITDFLAQDQMYALANLYFAHSQPLYGFLDQAWLLEHLGYRWGDPESCRAPDHLLAGVAAMGALFKPRGNSLISPAVLARLVELVKHALEGASTMQPPGLLDIQSWILRVIYLRATDHPHATWMATCTTMHLVESTGIHQVDSSPALPSQGPEHAVSEADLEVQRRTFWVARMLNTWVSFECGRTRVALRGITAQLPTPREGDYTADYVNLYSLSCCLDPERPNQADQWEDFLKQLEFFDAPHDGIELSIANLGLCAYRRLRLASPNLAPELLNRVIGIGLRGLRAARRMAERGMPWWHIANVPFQVICVFLAMDIRESLGRVSTAMRTLEDVVARFDTVAMREALKTARFLVRLSKKRKDEDSDILGQTLKKVGSDGGESDPQPENLRLHREGLALTSDGSSANGGGGSTAQRMTQTPMTASSNEDWNMDMLNNADFDWDYFLTADMPAFNSFAPDGTM
ncbi:Hypothetical protein R9X50_00454500 [Acrodontium crateriforme]|uniref:Zn(2)-C6 fungal-type domain-containing protein n=1 Tax=Acrodontium crateriforme TaxID=150365 RepID=A0AAQ3RCU3_9PEZI|nr:Hypothetical protein R9X50_00454500 [Acrodontium crateriforme]